MRCWDDAKGKTGFKVKIDCNGTIRCVCDWVRAEARHYLACSWDWLPLALKQFTGAGL